MRRALACSISLLALVPATAEAVPSVSRSALDPGQLVVESPTVAGEFEYIVISTRDATTVVSPDPDSAPPPEFWNVTAPDCAQDPATKEVVCTGPVTSLALVGGEGDDGLVATRFDFPVIGTSGVGDDVLIGGRDHDQLDAGPGADSVQGGPAGNDRLVGGTEDDTISGGPGADRVVGGDGRDRMRAQGGLDRVAARDGAADGLIDCGPGSDKKERAKVDPEDPKPKSC